MQAIPEITMIELYINSNISKDSDMQHKNSAHPNTSPVDCHGVMG